MKKLLTTLAAFTAMTAAATAADLPRRAAPPVFTPIPVFTWTGFYAGFNVGYGFNVKDDPAVTYVYANGGSGLFSPSPGGTPLVPGVVAFNNRSSFDGFTGGGQVGYNFQFTPGAGFVVGVEADAQYVDFGRGRNRFAGPVDGAGNPLFLNPNYTLVNPNGISSLDYFGTVRGRLGYAFDRVLFYGTGGFAYGAGGGRSFGQPNSDADDFRTGWTVGAGVEYALPTDSFLNFFRASAVTFKVEGLYVNLDRGGGQRGVFAFNNSGGQPATISVFDNRVAYAVGYAGRKDDEFAVLRAGMNYKFGSY